jgi:glycosyltransferase involved in cell wall biosynthesis
VSQESTTYEPRPEPATVAATDGAIDDLDRNMPLGAVTVSVIVPALDEAENLPHVLPKIPGWVHEVILVDDHSTDDTVAVARQLMPDIRIVPNLRPKGKGNALQSGYEAATGEILVQVDADGSENPAEIHAFVGVLMAGADYAKGSRFIPGGGTSDMTFLRKSGNKAFVLMVRALFGVRFTDLCYGYNAFWARVVPDLEIDADGFEIETMLNIRAARQGLKIAEVPSYEADRIHGEGRLLTFPDGWRVLKTIGSERMAAWREDRAR